MSTRVYTALNPFNFIRKHFLQIRLCLSAQRFSERISEYYTASIIEGAQTLASTLPCSTDACVKLSLKEVVKSD